MLAPQPQSVSETETRASITASEISPSALRRRKSRYNEAPIYILLNAVIDQKQNVNHRVKQLLKKWMDNTKIYFPEPLVITHSEPSQTQVHAGSAGVERKDSLSSICEFPAGFGFYLLGDYTVSKLFPEMNHYYEIIMGLGDKDTQDRFLSFLHDYMLQKSIMSKAKKKRINVLEDILAWMEMRRTSGLLDFDTRFSELFEAEGHMREFYINHTLDTLQKLLHLRKSISGEIELEKEASSDLESILAEYTSESIKPEAPKVADEETSAAASELNKLITGAKTVSNAYELEQAEMRVEEVIRTIAIQESELVSCKDDLRRKEEEAKIAKRKVVLSMMEKDELEKKLLELQIGKALTPSQLALLREVRVRMTPEEKLTMTDSAVQVDFTPKYEVKYDLTPAQIKLLKSQHVTEEQGRQSLSKPKKKEHRRHSEKLHPHSPGHNKHAFEKAMKLATVKKAVGAIKTAAAAQQAGTGTGAATGTATGPATGTGAGIATGNGARTESGSGLGSGPGSGTGKQEEDEHHEHHEHHDLLTMMNMYVDNATNQVRSLIMFLVKLRTEAREEIDLIAEKRIKVEKIAEKIEQLIIIVDKEHDCLPSIEIYEDSAVVYNRMGTGHRCMFCLCQDIMDTVVLDTVKDAKELNRSLDHCEEYKSLLTKIKSRFRSMSEELTRIYQNVQHNLDALTWGKNTGLENEWHGVFKRKIKSDADLIEEITNMKALRPKDKAHLVLYTKKVEQSLASLTRLTVTTLSKCKLRIDDARKQTLFLRELDERLVTVESELQSTFLQLVRTRCQGNVLQKSKMVRACVCRWCHCMTGQGQLAVLDLPKDMEDHQLFRLKKQGIVHGMRAIRQGMDAVLTVNVGAQGTKAVSAVNPVVLARTEQAGGELINALEVITTKESKILESDSSSSSSSFSSLESEPEKVKDQKEEDQEHLDPRKVPSERQRRALGKMRTSIGAIRDYREFWKEIHLTIKYAPVKKRNSKERSKSKTLVRADSKSSEPKTRDSDSNLLHKLKSEKKITIEDKSKPVMFKKSSKLESKPDIAQRQKEEAGLKPTTSKADSSKQKEKEESDLKQKNASVHQIPSIEVEPPDQSNHTSDSQHIDAPGNTPPSDVDADRQSVFSLNLEDLE